MRLAVALAAALALSACQKQAALPDMAKESEAFMAKAVKEPDVKLLPTGEAIKIVRSGPANGLRPQKGDEIKVHYEGKLVNGHVFDSSYERGQPAAMPLDHLIPAWEHVLPLMRPGDEWTLYVPSNQGYGKEGAPGGEIPPNSALIFRIELLDVLPRPGRIQQG